jgi:hypothetical protein
MTQSEGDPNQEHRDPLIMVIEDGNSLSIAFQQVCSCLNVSMEHLTSRMDVSSAMRGRRPMAVIAHMAGEWQDGCHVLMSVAAHDRSLPVLLITGPDATLLGAADAVEEVWGLTGVEKVTELPPLGVFMDFVFRAGRAGRCMRLMPAS